MLPSRDRRIQAPPQQRRDRAVVENATTQHNDVFGFRSLAGLIADVVREPDTKERDRNVVHHHAHEGHNADVKLRARHALPRPPKEPVTGKEQHDTPSEGKRTGKGETFAPHPDDAVDQQGESQNYEENRTNVCEDVSYAHQPRRCPHVSCRQTKEAFEKKNDGQLQNKSVRNAVGVFFG